jgi:dUTP pyrophosphatase
MKVRFQKIKDEAQLPRYGSEGAAALDIILPTDIKEVAFHAGETKVIPLGFRIEIPAGHVGKVKARSSMWSKGWRVSGFIDADYRGEVGLMIQAPALYAWMANPPSPFVLLGGQKVAQLLIEATLNIEPEWADELTATARGEGGFGSTDRKP